MSSKLQLDVVTTVCGGAIWWMRTKAKGRNGVVCRLNCLIHVWAPWGRVAWHLRRYINPRTFTFTFITLGITHTVFLWNYSRNIFMLAALINCVRYTSAYNNTTLWAIRRTDRQTGRPTERKNNADRSSTPCFAEVIKGDVTVIRWTQPEPSMHGQAKWVPIKSWESEQALCVVHKPVYVVLQCWLVSGGVFRISGGEARLERL